ncbi:polysaccharide pyruvyl transferase family protein [bacterium]|nr:polysaccharide pyruvyl transferase family protein [candidate division CSSED10-310 bacterium]
MNVLVINHYSSNKGDRAMLYFLVRELKKGPVESITVSAHDRTRWKNSGGEMFSSVKWVPWGFNVEMPENPGGFRRRLAGLKHRCFPGMYSILRRGLISGKQAVPARFLCNAAFYRAMRTADLVISAGGHHITTILARDAVSGQLYDMALTLKTGKRLVLWSQSIGPLDFEDMRNRQLVRHILSGAAAVIVRDEQSKRVLQDLDLDTSRVQQTSESVLGLHDLQKDYIFPSDREPVAGIAIYGAQARSPEAYDSYIKIIAEIADHAVNRGYSARFFPMELKSGGSDDRGVIRSVIQRMKSGDKASVEDRDLDTPEHLRQVAGCRLFIGHKTHSVIFALTAGTPLIAIAYHKKTEDFMAQFDLAEYCIPDRHLNPDHLRSLFDRLSERCDEIGQLEFAGSRDFGNRVQADFQAMLTGFASR